MEKNSELAEEPIHPSLTALVTFAIANFNGETTLPRTLDALLALHSDCRIVVVDDGSTDGSRALVRDRFPTVDVIEFPKNEGKVARVRKRAVDECRTPYLMLLDNDVTFAPDCIRRLLSYLKEHPNALSCRPRLVYSDRPDVIYQDAAELHYLALSSGQRRGRPVEEGLLPLPRQTIGGGIMLLNCAIVRNLGNFDDNYLFGWSDDSEIDVRARLFGYETWQDPHAIGYHREQPPGIRRVLGQLYNRRRLILICYSARSLLLLGPALLVFEGLVLLMCLSSGYGRQYVQACKLLKAHFADIRSRRRQLQRDRTRRSDRGVLTGASFSITGRMTGSRAVMVLSPVLNWAFGVYWKLVRPLI